MHHPIRRELDFARLAARERRLRLVMQILGARNAEYERTGVLAPAGLRDSIADFGRQLRDVHGRQSELAGPHEPAQRPARPPAERTNRFATRSIAPRVRQSLSD
jgi:hypothetical protein